MVTTFPIPTTRAWHRECSGRQTMMTKKMAGLPQWQHQQHHLLSWYTWMTETENVVSAAVSAAAALEMVECPIEAKQRIVES
jgi:hypothetical protein